MYIVCAWVNCVFPAEVPVVLVLPLLTVKREQWSTLLNLEQNPLQHPPNQAPPLTAHPEAADGRSVALLILLQGAHQGIITVHEAEVAAERGDTDTGQSSDESVFFIFQSLSQLICFPLLAIRVHVFT